MAELPLTDNTASPRMSMKSFPNELLELVLKDVCENQMDMYFCREKWNG